MEFKFDKQKSAEKVASIVQNTSKLGQKVFADTKVGLSTMVEKQKAAQQERLLKKYNPLFPEQYNDPNFNLPNLITIVDDAVRRGIEVCEGAIGWLDNKSGTEVLFMYDEFVSSCGLQFVPVATCDATYYVDSFNRNRFIRVDCIFNKAHEERLAELEHIAFSLGAKRCSVEIVEAVSDAIEKKKSVSVSESYHGVNSTESAEQSVSSNAQAHRSGRIESEFQGHDTPTEPTLKWFAHDDTIKSLVNMRCSGDNSVKIKTLELSGSSCATMSQKTARAIDCTLVNGESSLESKAKKEHHSKLIYHVEF